MPQRYPEIGVFTVQIACKGAIVSTANIVATFFPLKGHDVAVRQELETMVGYTRQEPGNLRYDLFTRANDDGRTIFVLIERYQDEAALQAHRSADYFAAYRAAVVPQLERPIEAVLLTDLDVPVSN